MRKMILALFVGAVLSMAAMAGPSIHVAINVYDFGSITEGFPVTHTFVLQNTGDEALQISGVKTSCHCTTAALATSSLAPGESVDLAVTIDTTGYRGTITKLVSVSSNDEDMPILTLRITGEVLAPTPGPSIHAPVDTYDFGSVTAGFAVTHTFVLQNAGDEVLQISGIQTSCGCTTTALSTSSLAPGESVDLQVTVNTAGFHGTISKLINVSSNDPDTPVLTLRVTGQVLSAQPNQIAVSDAYYYLYLLVDLRSPEAYAAHHIIGSVNIPLDQLDEAITNLPTDAFIVLYDASFTTSEDAALQLRDAGYRTTYALIGGLDEWERQYGMKFVTNPDVDYQPGDQPAPTYDQRPAHLMIASDLDSIYLLYIDVRSPEAYAAGHIMGALNVPFDDLASMASSLPRGVTLITYDDTGDLGDQAAQWLLDNDFSMALSLLGGLNEWTRQYGEGYLLTSSGNQDGS